MRGKGMAQTVRRIMVRDPGHREILMHQDVHNRPEQMRAMRFGTGKNLRSWGGVRLPELQYLLHIRGDVDNAIHLALAPGNAYRPGVEINSVPGQGTHLR